MTLAEYFSVKNDILVDTSVFIDFLRGDINDTLTALILNNQVLLSAVVRLELLAGVHKSEVKVVDELLTSLKLIPTFPAVEETEALLKRARGAGLLGGLPDLLILADAKHYNVPLYTIDNKMKRLAAYFRVSVVG